MTQRLIYVTAAAFLALLMIAPPVAAQEGDGGPALQDIVDAWMSSPHNARETEAFRHWDEDGEIPGSCAVCHSSIGFTDYIRSERAEAATIDHPVALGTTVDCAVCHNSAAAALTDVLFPSGVVSSDFGDSAVCATCHQGRASSVQVRAATAGMDDDAVSGDLRFINVHYKAAAATLLGGGVQGGFEYDGKTYAGRFGHVPDFATCSDCHAPHSLEIRLESCTTCHQGVEALDEIRLRPVDFDGDTDVTEGIAHEIETVRDILGAAIAAYAADVAGAPVVYAEAYPYFFNDTNADGQESEGEAIYPNRYASWTPRLLRAAYNYQYAQKDAGGYAHNPSYVLQILYDSIADLGARVDVEIGLLTRP